MNRINVKRTFTGRVIACGKKGVSVIESGNGGAYEKIDSYNWCGFAAYGLQC